MQQLLVALPDLQPQAERGRKVNETQMREALDPLNPTGELAYNYLTSLNRDELWTVANSSRLWRFHNLAANIAAERYFKGGGKR